MGGFQIDHFHPGQRGRLRFIGRHGIDHGHHFIGYFLNRRRIENDAHAAFMGNANHMFQRIHIDFHLNEQHICLLDQRLLGADILRCDVAACAVEHHNHVLTALLIDHNQRCAGFTGFILDPFAGIHALRGIKIARDAAKRIPSQFCDQRDISAGAESGDRLIGTFAARPHLERCAQHRFPRHRETRSPSGQIRHIAAENDNASAHLNPPFRPFKSVLSFMLHRLEFSL